MSVATSTQSGDHNLTVFYDGHCPLCSREIEVYRAKNERGSIAFVDIMSPNFDASKEGLDPEKVHKVFHVKDSESNILTAIDGFVAIWDELNIFRPLSFFAKQSMTRPLFDLGYNMFAKVRPLLPKRDCEEGTCQI